MHVFELAEDLKAPVKDVIKYLCGIGYVVKRDMDMVPLAAEARVRKELAPILEKQRLEFEKKEALKLKELNARRETERKKREADKKKQDAERKLREREEEKRAREEQKQREKQAKEDEKRRKEEPKHPVEDARKAKHAEAGKKEEAKKPAAPVKEAGKPAPQPPAKPVHGTPAKPGEKQPPATGRPAAHAPMAVAVPAAAAKPGHAPEQKPAHAAAAKPPHAAVHAHEPKPGERPAAGRTTGAHPAHPPAKPAVHAAKQAPIALPKPGERQPPLPGRTVIQQPLQQPLHAKHGAHAPVKLAHPGAQKAVHPVAAKHGHAPAQAKHGAPARKIEMVPLDRIKKTSMTRAEEIKNSLEQAQAQTLTKRSPREEPVLDEPKAKKKERAQFVGVENRDELINRPRLSSSAELRQMIADKSAGRPRGDSRLVRKRKHGQRTSTKPVQQLKDIVIELPVSVRDFSQATGIKVGDLISRMMRLGTMVTINQQLDRSAVEVLAAEFHLTLAIREPGKDLEEIAFGQDDEGDATDAGELEKRPPVVTFMGHVDHGKTSLLDAIRQTNVAAGESGGITQHIGAYEVTGSFGSITFIDTPGHEAFTAMRARGAHVTDIAVLVVAADDGLMPQSLEAINHARAAGVPILVAINKCDLPGANPERVYAQLAEQNLTPEDWGGDTICCKVSAVAKTGIEHLLEMISLQADILTDADGQPKLRARTTGPAHGVVLEAERDPSQGPTVTLLVQEGTLHKGDPLVCATCFGRVRALLDHTGEPIDEAGPSMPVQVLGFDDVPAAGSTFRMAASQKHARELVDERRSDEQLKRHSHGQRITLENFHKSMASEQAKELAVIIKGDTQGTTEALRTSLEQLTAGNAKVNVLHCGVGDITENDVMLASASNAVIIGFHVALAESARPLAKSEGVDISMYEVIYHVTEAVQAALAGLLEPVFKEVETGVAQVRAVFDLSAGMIAGCYVQSGAIQRSNKARVVRGSDVVFDGEIQSLKHVKDEVREARAGFECGILLREFKDVKEGDLIKAYKLERETPLVAAGQ